MTIIADQCRFFLEIYNRYRNLQPVQKFYVLFSQIKKLTA